MERVLQPQPQFRGHFSLMGTFYSSVVKHSQEIVFLLHFNITGPHRHTDLSSRHLPFSCIKQLQNKRHTLARLQDGMGSLPL